MAVLTVQTITTAGVEPASLVSAASGGDSFPNNGKTFLDVANGGESSITVTIASQRLCDQGSTHDLTNTIGAGDTERMGPFDPARFNDGNGRVQVTYSDATDVTVGAFALS